MAGSGGGGGGGGGRDPEMRTVFLGFVLTCALAGGLAVTGSALRAAGGSGWAKGATAGQVGSELGRAVGITTGAARLVTAQQLAKMSCAAAMASEETERGAGGGENATKIGVIGLRQSGAGPVASMLSSMVGEGGTYSPAKNKRVTKLLVKGKDFAALQSLKPFTVLADAPIAGAGIAPTQALSTTGAGPATTAAPFYQKLARHFPTARFVLTERAPAEWWPDVWRRTSCTHPRTKQGTIAQLGATSFKKGDMVRAYAQYNAEVKRFFASVLRQPERLLVIDVGFDSATLGAAERRARGEEPWACLCAFAGIPASACTTDVALPVGNEASGAMQSTLTKHRVPPGCAAAAANGTHAPSGKGTV